MKESNWNPVRTLEDTKGVIISSEAVAIVAGLKYIGGLYQGRNELS